MLRIRNATVPSFCGAVVLFAGTALMAATADGVKALEKRDYATAYREL